MTFFFRTPAWFQNAGGTNERRTTTTTIVRLFGESFFCCVCYCRVDNEYSNEQPISREEQDNEWSSFEAVTKTFNKRPSRMSAPEQKTKKKRCFIAS